MLPDAGISHLSLVEQSPCDEEKFRRNVLSVLQVPTRNKWQAWTYSGCSRE
jgi:hypothetical protein